VSIVVSTQFAPINRETIAAALFAFLQSRLTAPPWAPSTAYTIGEVVTDPRGHLQKALANGTSLATPPDPWNDAGGETADGTGDTAFNWQDTGAGFVSMGRKHVKPPQLKTPDQPALFQVFAEETGIPQKPPGNPAKLLMKGFLVVYAYNPSPQENIGQEQLLGETIINNILFAIDGALQPDDPNSGKFTIGGLVTHCWREGRAVIDPGIFGNQLGALLPLNVFID
jgi:hypothetical protein